MDVATDVNTGEKVVLELNTDASGDAPRYRMVSVSPKLTVERVPDDAAGDFHPDHKFDCPAFNAGRTF